MLMKTKTHIDFNEVEPQHREIDKRLVNWGRSCYSGMGGGSSGMFRWVKPSQQWDEIETRIPVDRHDAMLIAKGVAQLPSPHSMALNWLYVQRTPPARGRALLGVTMDGLNRYVRDARIMLINRGV